MNGIPQQTELEIKTRLAAVERKLSRLFEHLQIEEPAGLGPGEVPPGVAEALQRGDTLAAIKAYREATGADLAEAKAQVERIDSGAA